MRRYPFQSLISFMRLSRLGNWMPLGRMAKRLK